MSIEREEFERAVTDRWSDSYSFTRFGDEDYYDEIVEGMWRGWQASRQAIEGEGEAVDVERIADTVRDHLGDIFDYTRVWSAYPVADFGHDPNYHTKKSRGKGKKRKQWEQGQ